jgi:hypothetical protein
MVKLEVNDRVNLNVAVNLKVRVNLEVMVEVDGPVGQAKRSAGTSGSTNSPAEANVGKRLR